MHGRSFALYATFEPSPHPAEPSSTRQDGVPTTLLGRFRPPFGLSTSRQPPRSPHSHHIPLRMLVEITPTLKWELDLYESRCR